MEDCIFDILSYLDDEVENSFGFRIDPFLVIEPLGKKIAGMADYGNNTIYLNSNFMEKHKHEMLSDTLIHEYCHLMTVGLFGLNGIKRNKYYSHHGKEWKRCMEFFGLEPNIYHEMRL